MSQSNRSFDVIVAGVGSVGSAACYHLADRGAAVLGLERSPDVVRRVLGSLPRNSNTRGDKRRDAGVTWESLPKGALFDELVELARGYGYEPGCVDRLQAG